ncbi:hypothetical protein DPMN_146834 [Dreissena polymorpha]|uniref:Uncharacterized protein n=1 Tax=Dreissena polymorpha TaxID=45954 RepID=A0A9D4IYS4_DREPO|nr:hypothetical protein DPMN_146834 [Dreissena polymorpha]
MSEREAENDNGRGMHFKPTEDSTFQAKCLQKIHTSSRADLQLGKIDDDVIYPDLPQVGVPNLQTEELLSFRGLKTIKLPLFDQK